VSGSIGGQLAKLREARVPGSPANCRYVVDELGLVLRWSA
jgi:NADPH-dependent curcumin reductase CurA